MDTSRTVANDEAGTLRREIAHLQSDLDRLRTDFKQLAGDAVHAAKTGAFEAKERIGQTARAAATKGRESAQELEHQVAEHPYVALATAFTVGMALGFGLSRKA